MGKQTKLITTLENALKTAGIKVKRDGWVENKHSVPPNDTCSWLDIKLKQGKKKYLIHLYFTHNSTVLSDIEIWKGKLSDAKLLARTPNEQTQKERDKKIIIKTFEKTLNRYRKELKKNPNSGFYAGLVKNTEEFIKQLKEENGSKK